MSSYVCYHLYSSITLALFYAHRMDPVDSDLLESGVPHSPSSSGSVSPVSSSFPFNHLEATSSTSAAPVINGGSNPSTQPRKALSPPLSNIGVGASHYQLVYGLDDVSSEASLIDSPLSRAPPNTFLLQSSFEEAMTVREDGGEDTDARHAHSNQAPPSCAPGDNHTSFSPPVFSSPPQCALNSESATPLPHPSTAGDTGASEESIPDPAGDGREETDGIAKCQQMNKSPSENSALSEYSPTNIHTSAGDSSSSKPHTPLRDDASSNYLPMSSHPEHETGSSSPQQLLTNSHVVDAGTELGHAELDNTSLPSRSPSPIEKNLKIHPLSILTSDSDADEDPPGHTRSYPHNLYIPFQSTSGTYAQLITQLTD